MSQLSKWSAAPRPPFKVCTCCTRPFTYLEWDALELVGRVLSDDETGFYRTEMRNCPAPCSSTIAVELAIDPPRPALRVEVCSHSVDDVCGLCHPEAFAAVQP